MTGVSTRSSRQCEETMSPVAEISTAVIETAREARTVHRESIDADADIVRLPEAAVTELVRRLVTTAHQRICQIVPFSPRRRIADRFSHQVSGELATCGTTVQRLYLVPAGDVRNSELNSLIAEDRERSVDARSLVVGASAVEALDESTAQALDEGATGPVLVPMKDMWLVDDQAVIRQEFGAEGPPVWVVSVREQDVADARDLWLRLWSNRERLLPDRVLLNLTDPLLESADMIYFAAQMGCKVDYVDETSCSWYHGVWPYLRLCNMVSSPRWHPEFYDTALRVQLGDLGARRVLISGTADYSMLSFVMEAAGRHRGELDVHVVDRCPTPLSACRWYAKRTGIDIQVHEKDVLDDIDELTRVLAPQGDHPARSDFDLVVSDAFLTRFAPEDACRVLQNWAALLRPGGAVITTVRLHPRDGELQGVTHDVTEFLLRLRRRAENWRWLLKIDIDELVDAAREYALKMTSRDLGDLDDVLGLFETNGFDLLQYETARVEGELCETEYARVVATVR